MTDVADSKKRKADEKAKVILERVLTAKPDFTGKIILNFHQGNLGDRANIEEVLQLNT